MACDHLGGPDVIDLAERDLRARGVEPVSGMRFRHGENLDDGMWAAVVIEIERRGERWVVTRLDRGEERLPDAETGLKQLVSS